MEKDIVDPILELLPKDQWDEVMNQENCDIEPVFMGFTDIYKKLSEIIPHHWTVVDLGAAYNPQCYYFTKHKKYIAVDTPGTKMFKAHNCEIYQMTIGQFINDHLKDLYLPETFAICSYVPMWYGDNIEVVTHAFKNLFVYYPHGSHKIINVNKPSTK